MDWKTIKSILIVVLVITNSILLYNYLGTTDTETYLDRDSLYQMYEAKGISFAEDVDISFPNLFGIEASAAVVSPEMQQRILDYFIDYDDEFYLKTLYRSVSYVRYDIFELLESAEQEESAADVLPEERRVDEDDEDSISRDCFSLSNYLVLEEVDISEDEKQAMLNKVIAFFQDTGILFDPVFINVYDVNGFQVARVYQVVNQTAENVAGNEGAEEVCFPDIESEIYLYFEEGEIVGLSIVKLMNLNQGYTRIYDIISVEDAMYKALPLSPQEESIQSVGIVYKLNDSSLLASNLVVGEMLPYYEFRFEQGVPIYIRAVK